MASLSATTSSESRLAAAWSDWRRRGRKALIPYLTAGYPDRAGSLELLRASAGLADVIEVGVPFRDPLADGPTIQRASFEALRRGMTLAGTLELIAEAAVAVPVIVFSYVNPVLRYGVDRFLRDAADAGAAGVLLTDVPTGAAPDLEQRIRDSPLDLIRLIAPTTSGPRLREVVQGAQGFLYLIARLGVTGATAALDEHLAESIARVRASSDLPLAVGFGISGPEQAARVAGLADGVVIGSALVERLGRGGPGDAVALLRDLRTAVDRGGAR
ncbi:MAG: tryptophan synthase subunit alpha [Gemmatimonadales bacterium]